MKNLMFTCSSNVANQILWFSIYSVLQFLFIRSSDPVSLNLISGQLSCVSGHCVHALREQNITEPVQTDLHQTEFFNYISVKVSSRVRNFEEFPFL